MRVGHLLVPGDTLGGFRIDGIIGFGGMAVVYRAQQVSLGRSVALKVLSSKLSDDLTFRERFRREGIHAAALDHPNIVPVYDSGEAEGRLYLAMRLVEGETLGDRLRAEGGLSAAGTLAILRPIAGALDFAHRARVVHRDVKPQNILLSTDGHAYLADFGIAKGLQTDALTSTGGFVGTLSYAAPEQIRGMPASPAGDIYALTSVLFECLTGRVPYPRDTEAGVMHAHLTEPPPVIAGHGRAEVELTAIIARGMAKQPAQRFERAGAMLDAVVAAVALLPSDRATHRPSFAALERVPVVLAETVLDSRRMVDPASEENEHLPDARVVGNSSTMERLAPLPEHAALPATVPNQPDTREHDRKTRHAAVSATHATATDRRRPTPPPMAGVGRVRRRRLLPMAAAAVTVTAASATAVALVTFDGGATKPRPRVVVARNAILAVAHGTAWRRATSTAAARGWLTDPVVLRDGPATFSAGSLVQSSLVPGGLPPALRAALGKPTETQLTHAERYPASLYRWNRGSVRTEAYVLAGQTADVALVCQEPSQASGRCAPLIRGVSVTGIAVVAPGQSTLVSTAVAAELEPVSAARQDLSGLRAASLANRAVSATRISRTETEAATALAAIAHDARAAGLIDAESVALRHEAIDWYALASAASAGSRAQYDHASATVVTASRRLRSATAALHTIGLRPPPLPALMLPGPPRTRRKQPKTGATGPKATGATTPGNPQPPGVTTTPPPTQTTTTQTTTTQTTTTHTSTTHTSTTHTSTTHTSTTQTTKTGHAPVVT
jgi:serine/threonine protein kinase